MKTIFSYILSTMAGLCLVGGIFPIQFWSLGPFQSLILCCRFSLNKQTNLDSLKAFFQKSKISSSIEFSTVNYNNEQLPKLAKVNK